MSGSIIKRKSRLHISLLALLFLLLFALISNAIDSNDINDISTEERAALKDKTLLEIIFASKSESKSLSDVATLIVVKLKDETVLESLTKLHEPGPHIFGIPPEISGKLQIDTSIPLPKDSDAEVTDLWEILNNRRFVKLIQNLRALPKGEAAILVNREIEASLVAYDKMYSSYFEQALTCYNSVKANPVGKGILPALPFNNPDRTPTLKGLQCKILALALIAGNLELRDSQTVMQKVVDYAIRQRNKLYDKKSFEEQFSSLMLRISLYNRRILGTAILGTYLTRDETKQILLDIQAGFQERKMKPYDYIPTEPLLGMRSLRLLEETDGEVQVRHLEPLDNTQFDKLLADGRVRIRHIEPLDDSQFDKLVDAANKTRQRSMVPRDTNEVSR